MKILFVIKKEIYSAQEPLGILSLSSVLKKNGHQVFLSDCSLKKINCLIREENIGLLAISCMNTDYKDYLNLSRKIKKNFPKILIIWGGPTPTYNPEIIRRGPIDIICRGEGEIALLELVNRLEKKKSINRIPNLWVKSNSFIYKNKVGPLIANLDRLPLPDRSLTRDFPQFRLSPIKFVMAGRGCPFNCWHCFNHNFHRLYRGQGKIFRTRSVAHLMQELEELKTHYQAKFFYFTDDIFPYQDRWLADFSQEYASRIKLPYTVVTSAAFVSESFVNCLKKSGCVSLHLGIETGNEKIRRKILNKPVSNQKIIEAFRLAREKGLATCAYNMIGIPFSKFENELETLDFNLQLKVDVPYVFFCLPFLDTKLGKMAQKAGLVSSQTKFFSYFERLPLKVKNREKLEKFSYLFPIVVLFPFLRRHLPLLLKIPVPKIVLKFLKDILNGYSLKRKIVPVKTSFKEFLVMTFFFISRRFSK